jgi:hypothetical protein
MSMHVPADPAQIIKHSPASEGVQKAGAGVTLSEVSVAAHKVKSPHSGILISDHARLMKVIKTREM